MNDTLNNPITISSALSDSPSSSTSAKYQFFDTKQLIPKILEKGWRLHLETEARVYNSKKQGFQRHMLIFKNPLFSNAEGNFQIVLRNAHDSSCSVEIFVGFMRIICQNQLFARELGTGSLIRIRHVGKDVQEKVIRGFNQMINFLPVYEKSIDRLRKRILSPAEMNTFALRAIALRFPDYEKSKLKIFPENFLEPRRNEDSGNSAWAVYNRVQENLIRGRIPIGSIRNGKEISTLSRPLKSMNRVPELNDKLLDGILEIADVK